MLSYILQTIAFQFLFLIIYEVFLKKETFFNWNRAYLLLTPVLSLIIPLVKITQLNTIVPQEFMVKLPTVFIGETVKPPVPANKIEPVATAVSNFWSLENAFYTGMAITTLLFVLKVIGVTKLIYRNPKFKKGNLIIVQLLKTTSAFSFFNYIFLGEQIDTQEKEAILKHEMVHVKQKHSLDLLFFEGLKIVFWFNPLIYVFQKKVQILHEFIADAEALKHQDKIQYYQNLLSQVFETKHVSFINPFFKQSLIKKRIIMLQKSKSKKVRLYKYVLLIPLILGMLVYSSCNNEDEYNTSKIKGVELTDEELKSQLQDELNEMKNSGAKLYEIHKTFSPKSKNYILSREEYYRRTIFFGELSREFVKNNEDGSKYKPKTYTEYLKWKKTDEAKEIWENQTHDGVLKLVVEDLSNMTPEEQKDYDKKMELLHNDDFFTSFIVSSNNVIVMMESENSVKSSDKAEDEFTKAIEVPFSVIEQVPVFPGCDPGTNDEQKKCTSQSITKFVNENFNTKLASGLSLKGRQRIHVIFKINKEGDIFGVRARAPHPELEVEAKRVVNLLPKFIPGKHKGEKVNVPYSLPIIFQVKD